MALQRIFAACLVAAALMAPPMAIARAAEAATDGMSIRVVSADEFNEIDRAAGENGGGEGLFERALLTFAGALGAASAMRFFVLV